LQLSVSSAKFLGIENCNRASSQKLRSVRSVFSSESIKSRDEIVVQLHQYLASSHEPYGNTYAPVAAAVGSQEVSDPAVRSH
jgi:hypothetical protein